jgi:hypothetical protein
MTPFCLQRHTNWRLYEVLNIRSVPSYNISLSYILSLFWRSKNERHGFTIIFHVCFLNGYVLFICVFLSFLLPFFFTCIFNSHFFVWLISAKSMPSNTNEYPYVILIPATSLYMADTRPNTDKTQISLWSEQKHVILLLEIALCYVE